MLNGHIRPALTVSNRVGFWAALVLILGLGSTPNNAQAIDSERILVLSAASAAPAIQDIADRFFSETDVDVRISIASSGTLARQIRQGAPADIYVSASQSWIDLLSDEGYLDTDRIQPLARNRLVFVGPAKSFDTALLDLSDPAAVARRLADGRLAIGDPTHVPAGVYAKETLESLRLWPVVNDRLALQTNVRAVLALVERGETQLGIVYATDAALSKGIRLAAIVPSSSHSPIVYTAAVLTAATNPRTEDFFESLKSMESLDIFERYGFGVTRPDIPAQSPNTGPSMP